MLFFTSDFHLGHFNPNNGNGIIKYASRPFATIEDMDKAIIDNFNSVVKPDDTVYYLGDFCWGQPLRFLDRINTKQIVMIWGNHDKNTRGYAKYFRSCHEVLDILVDDHPITLFHYTIRKWNRSHYNSWHLFGHGHSHKENIENYGKSFDIGVDAWDYYPVSYNQVKEKMATQPDNYNLIKR